MSAPENDFQWQDKDQIFIQAKAPDFFYITEKLLWKTMKIQLEEDVATLKTILEESSNASWHPPDDIQM